MNFSPDSSVILFYFYLYFDKLSMTNKNKKDIAESGNTHERDYKHCASKPKSSLFLRLRFVIPFLNAFNIFNGIFGPRQSFFQDI